MTSESTVSQARSDRRKKLTTIIFDTDFFMRPRTRLLMSKVGIAGVGIYQAALAFAAYEKSSATFLDSDVELLSLDLRVDVIDIVNALNICCIDPINYLTRTGNGWHSDRLQLEIDIFKTKQKNYKDGAAKRENSKNPMRIDKDPQESSPNLEVRKEQEEEQEQDLDQEKDQDEDQESGKGTGTQTPNRDLQRVPEDVSTTDTGRTDPEGPLGHAPSVEDPRPLPTDIPGNSRKSAEPKRPPGEEVRPGVFLTPEAKTRILAHVPSKKERDYWLNELADYARDKPVLWKKYRDHERVFMKWRRRHLENGFIWSESLGHYEKKPAWKVGAPPEQTRPQPPPFIPPQENSEPPTPEQREFVRSLISAKFPNLVRSM